MQTGGGVSRQFTPALPQVGYRSFGRSLHERLASSDLLQLPKMPNMDRTLDQAVHIGDFSTCFTPSNVFITVLGSLILCPFLTWFLCKLQSRPVLPGTGCEPPIVPYWLPWFQHLFAFLRNPNGLFEFMGFVFSQQ